MEKEFTLPVDDRYIVTLLAFILFILIDNYVYNNLHQVLRLPCVLGNLVKKVMVIILGILVVMEAVIVNRREEAPIFLGSN